MRKTLIFISIILLLGSCAPTAFRISHHETNLSQYSEDGFFITTGDYTKEYEPISILTSSCNSGRKEKQHVSQAKKPTSTKIKVDDIYFSPQDNNEYSWVNTNRQFLLTEMVAKAKASGADGLIRLRITTIYNYYRGVPVGDARYVATATAIKRKNKE